MYLNKTFAKETHTSILSTSTTQTEQNKMYAIDRSLYFDARSTGLIFPEYRLTNIGAVTAFNKVNANTFKKVSSCEFLAIKEAYYSNPKRLLKTSLSQDIYRGCCDACNPWGDLRMEAVLFPDHFQPWESDSDSYFVDDGDCFSLTYLGEIAFSRFLSEESQFLNRINKQENSLG